MNSKKSQKCVSALACLGILVLFAILAVVWVQFYQGSFRNIPLHQRTAKGDDGVMNYTVSAQFGDPHLKPRLKDLRPNSYLESLGLETNIEYIKPMKISPLPLHDHDIIFNEMNNYSDEPLLPHHSGHFRHSMAEVWDPHPRYELLAFGKRMKLQLAHDNQFIGPNLYISHSYENYTHRMPQDGGMIGCFYTGNVQGDSDSDVVVSLCNGMTGYIRTSEGTYYIEPVEFINGTLNSFLHRIKKVPHSSKHENEVTTSEETTRKCGTNISDTEINNEIQEEYPIALDLHNPIHNLVKRSTANDSYENPQDTSAHIRKKREDDDYFRTYYEEDFEENRPLEYFIKVLVVADRSMVEFYKTHEELNRYILTLMSQTARLFKDPTIGNAISVSVTEIRILEEQEFKASNSQDTLTKFCKWRQKFTVQSNHDVALLLTRHDFCEDRNRDCVTVGVARVGAMCTAKSCAIAMDKGLPTTYTIAHEIGHALNMPHDSDDNGRCAALNKGDSQKYIMAASLEKDIKPWMWSPCSKYYVTEFLGSKNAKCLRKRPTTNFLSTDLSNIPPGEKYEVKRQCEFEFGEGRDHCLPENEPFCMYLWCTENPNAGCTTNHMPWAEGTYCGPQRWCHNGQCIPLGENDLKPVAGGWGSWSEWILINYNSAKRNSYNNIGLGAGVPHGIILGTSSFPWGQCSRTCGGGVKMAQRFCDNPVPGNGGDYCVGQSTKYASCNTEPCPDSADFRAIQCASFDGDTNNLTNLPKDVKWLPKYGLEKEDQCKLYCRPQHSNAYYLLKSKVVDGTKCGFNSFGICIDGKCRSGGCDNKLHSKMQLDNCGVCGGDNSQCEEISGTYNITASSIGYNFILKFPKGSSSLEIEQKDQNDQKLRNYLALVDGDTGKYILNGNNVITEQQKDVVFGGSIIKYSGSNASVERITTAKNEILTKPLILEILSIDSRSPPPDVTYRYIISKENAPRYSWRLYQKEWTECSSICSGLQFMKPVCIELGNTEQIVDDYYCASRDTHGIVQKKECNNHCRLIWNPIKRGECSVNCGTGVRTVKYNCLKINNERENYSFFQIITADTYGDVVDDHYCNVLPPPQYTESCSGSCNVRWRYSDWSQCSQSCGGGFQTRTAVCVNNDNGLQVDDGDCRNSNKITERECKNSRCPQWITTEWSQCSSKCGKGYKRRAVYCTVGGNYYKDYSCPKYNKPEETAECNLKPCVEWAFNDWSACSVTCGNGIQTREVYCRSQDNQETLDASFCFDIPKPEIIQQCHLTKCRPTPIIYTIPRYSYGGERDAINNSVQIEFRGAEDWITGEWSACSKSCGRGFSSRKVECRGDYGGHFCDERKKPVSRTDCNTFRCPEWHLGGWSHCDKNCEKHRFVICRNDSGIAVPENQCANAIRPGETAKCRLSQCPHITNHVPKQYFDSRDDRSGRYKWKVGQWKECSTNCGKGNRTRDVTCEDSLNDLILVDQYCKDLSKPKNSKPCERFHCAFTWIESDWSPCSKRCGNGTKTRNVTCHKVYPGGLIDPNPIPYMRTRIGRHRHSCDMYEKPPEHKNCNEDKCNNDRYVWRHGPWKECSEKCGRKGRQVRQIHCVNVFTGEKVAKRFCPRNRRPKRKRKCNQWRCAYKSCADVKYSLRTRENRDYLLDIGGKRAVVYCFKMDTREPEEYISLMSDTQNYAEFYAKRLLDLDSCPHEGNRNDSCNCFDIQANRSGLTKFYKVRLDITTMQIKGDDYRFSRQEGIKRVPYGTAGDCYSRVPGCRQGRFSINLSGTSFKLAKDVQWIGDVTMDYRQDISVEGRCGGFCGECEPDPSTGLKVEVT